MILFILGVPVTLWHWWGLGRHYEKVVEEECVLGPRIRGGPLENDLEGVFEGSQCR